MARKLTKEGWSRREFVGAGLGAVASSMLGSTVVGAAGDQLERAGIAFEQELDAVDDLGMDPSGEEPVSDAVTSVPADTLVTFPDGAYLIDERLDLPTLGSVGFEGAGDATIVGAPEFADTAWNVRDTDAVYYAGFTHDQSDGAVGHFFRASDRIELHDVEVTGRGGTWGVELAPHLTEPDGVGRVVNYVNRAGSSWGAYAGSAGRIGCWLGGQHEGTLRFIDCDFREYGNNALYTSHCPGNVQVVDCYFENNNVASVRIGGEGSYVEDTEIVVDEDRYGGPREDEDGAFFLRGVLIEEHHVDRGQQPAGASVRGCDITIGANPTGGAGIEIWGNGRSLDLVHTRVRYDNAGTAAIRREEYGSKRNHPPGEDPRWLRMHNCVVTGAGETEAAIDIADGNGSQITNSEIHLTGAGDGIRIRDSTECIIANTNIDVPGEETAFDSADVDVRELTTRTPGEDALAHPAP